MADLRAKIAEAKELMFTTIPTKIKGGISPENYLTECRIPLNNLLIELTTGGELKADKKNIIVYNRKQPQANDLAEITSLLDAFIRQVEDPYLELVNDEDDDMEIPSESSETYLMSEIFTHDELKKLMPKKLTQRIYESLICNRLTTAEIIQIYAAAKTARHNKSTLISLIVGGGVVIVAAATATAIAVYNHKHNKDNSNADTENEVADIDADIDSDIDADIDSDIDDIDIADDDIPVVDIA